MGFLNPLFLLAAVAVGVPLFLHLFQRHESRRVPFPALRYLLRTEREHARRIRLRQLVLLFLRMGVVLLLVAAGARLFTAGRGEGHEPTAVAIVLDNSASSGRVVGDERVLDGLKRVAGATAAAATPEDRVWVLRAGEPWDAAVPGSPEEAAGRIRTTESSAAGADLAAAVRRARELVEASGLAGREIHLVSDLQESGLRTLASGNALPGGDVPLLVWGPETDRSASNRYLHEVRVGGGLPPLAGQRSDVAVSVGATGDPAPRVPLRLVVDERIRGAASTAAARTVVLPFGPFPAGVLEGYVETDPDDLPVDDRRWFTLEVRPPPGVALAGDAPFFVTEALGVLESGGRLRLAGPGGADVVVAVAGEGLGPAGAAVVVPPADPTLLPALNRRLASAGVPWRYGAPSAGGEVALGDSRIPVALETLRVRRHYALQPAGEAPSGDVLARLADGAPWLVSARSSGAGPVLLLASSLDADASDLPVSAAMVPLLEWAVTRWPGGDAARPGVEAGSPISLPARADAVETPDGTRHPVDATQLFRATSATGIHRVLRGDSVVRRVAVNAPLRESLLDFADPDEVADRLGSEARAVDDLDGWNGSVFGRRQGPELWRPLLVLALLLLLLESWIAASGADGSRRRAPSGPTRDARPAPEPEEARVAAR